ncbi:MAG: CdaR family protein [[Lactobacillus] timonensis]|jgi:YbbR domain-containing protein|uniref:CdaR family protein n=1 Tax=[Lactobacillus] timonensis TaxID=1970790 RepID=UPI0023535BB2|nr:CdaR family protein [[Lactobacillus] timonensis]MCI1926300.1 CdaR family protein [[Lactobacillus] timonensis]MCI1957661.1 CdaR family protein [[Lactobacillus] timonensis]MCI1970679.1 CdaR family protein [[Lactobacillus] timonensis]MCI2006825.1 CdaR family protein [[Lactobacillus] timonensis]
MKSNRNNDSFFSNIWVLRISSLILALFLFVYVNGSKDGFLRQNTRTGNNSALMSNRSATIKMPLQLKVNSQRYVITGYPQYVRVKVSGPSALVTTTVNTQNFKVYADLSNLGVGHHTIKLRTSGLNSELRTALTPEKIKVNIQPRATTTVPVEVRLSSKSVNGGYEVGTPKSSMTNVQVSGARDEVRRVAKVVAEVNVPKDATSDLHRQVTLQALDKHGHILNVIISPNSVSVTVPISSNGMASSSNRETSSDSSNSSSAKDNQNNDDSSTESSNANSTSNNN